MDIANSSAVRAAVYKMITRKNPQPFIPHEFTQRGMLERVGTYLMHQNFCDGKNLALGKTGVCVCVWRGVTSSIVVACV